LLEAIADEKANADKAYGPMAFAAILIDAAHERGLRPRNRHDATVNNDANPFLLPLYEARNLRTAF